MSSLKVATNCIATLHEHSYGGGRVQQWDGKKHSWGDGDNNLETSWIGNDTISSVSVRCWIP